MQKKVVVVGGAAGAHIAAEIFEKQYKTVLYLETYSSSINKDKSIGERIELGIDFLQQEEVDYFIATGDNLQREKNYKYIFQKTGKHPVNCIHSTAVIASSSKIGYGNLICPYAVIHTQAVIGNNTIINTASIIEHNCVINDYAQISPNATLCGYVSVGEFSFVGAGSVVIPKIEIGKHSIVAAGASVVTHIPDSVMFAGVPAKFKKNL